MGYWDWILFFLGVMAIAHVAFLFGFAVLITLMKKRNDKLDRQYEARFGIKYEHKPPEHFNCRSKVDLKLEDEKTAEEIAEFNRTHRFSCASLSYEKTEPDVSLDIKKGAEI